MESDLKYAWSNQLYWIALKYDLDPTDENLINLFNEVYEEGWLDGFNNCVFLTNGDQEPDE